MIIHITKELLMKKPTSTVLKNSVIFVDFRPKQYKYKQGMQRFITRFLSILTALLVRVIVISIALFIKPTKPRKKKAMIINFEIERAKRNFIEQINEYILFYKEASGEFQDYYFNGISTHITTAHALGWHDVEKLIVEQFSKMANGQTPDLIIVNRSQKNVRSN